MKSGIIFLIHWAIVFVVLVIYGFLAKNVQNKANSMFGALLTSAIIAAIILLFSSKLNVNENFTFRVSDAKQKCMDEQVTGGPIRSPGCCSKDTTGVGSSKPFPMTRANFPYRADEFSPNQKAAVPPIESCDCDNKAYAAAVAAGVVGAKGDEDQSVQYPSKYQTLQDRPDVDSKDPAVENFSCSSITAKAIKNAKIEMYVAENCTHCNKTKESFKDAGIDEYITFKNASDNMEFLKAEGVKAIPFLKCSSGSHEGYCNGPDDLIKKLQIIVEKQVEQPVEQPVDTSETFKQQADQARDGNTLQGIEPVKKEKYESFIGAATPKQIVNPNGIINEDAVEYFIENFAPNYKSENYHSKPEFYSGYYSYENYLPDSVKYGSMAGQITPPGPCGRSQEGTR